MSEEINGYPNRETYDFCLWTDNDQSLYEFCKSVAAWAVERGYEYFPDIPVSEVRIGEEVVAAVRELMLERAEEMPGTDAGREAMRMLLDVGSWWRIDAAFVGERWREAVAENQ